MAASTTTCEASVSIVMPKLLHPSPTADTDKAPIFRISMRLTLYALFRDGQGMSLNLPGYCAGHT